jgi:type III pantothenate kinase
MFLAIDVGNTDTVIGVFEADARIEDDPVDHWRIATQERRAPDELALVLRSYLRFSRLDFNDLSAVAISSGVPHVTGALREMCGRYIPVPALVLEPGVKTGMPVLYDNPKEVGPDRIANAVAAFEAYGGPCIVVDFGTATTLDGISERGEYLGGAISPGIETSISALFERAAMLRRVELVPPKSVIGRSTAEAIQSGMVHGFAGQADHMVRLFRNELGGGEVVATGGLASVIAHHCETIEHVDPWLTLRGLRIIHSRNQ